MDSDIKFYKSMLLFSSWSVTSDFLWPHGLQHARFPCPSSSPWACSNSCPLSQWFHPTISSSVVPFSSCLQSFPASGSFLMSQLFASGGQSIGASASVLPKNTSASVLPKNLFPNSLEFISKASFQRILQHQSFQRIYFFRIDWLDFLAVQGTLKSFLQHHFQKHQFFGGRPSLCSNSHIHTSLLEKP